MPLTINNKLPNEQLHDHNCNFSSARLLHCGDLDELLEQDGSFDQVFTEAELAHHPVLNLVEAAHKALQVGRYGARELLTAKNVMDKLCLEEQEGDYHPRCGDEKKNNLNPFIKCSK